MESAADLSDGRAELCRDPALHSKDCRTRAQAFGRSRQQERAGKQGRGCGKAGGKQARTRQERGPGESAHARQAGEGCEGRSQAPGRSDERRVGKECAVRVDLGGSRLIKKKNKPGNRTVRTQTGKD